MPTIRVGTWNLLHGATAEHATASPHALARAAATLEVDLLALQEVDRFQQRSGGVAQDEVVAEACGLGHLRFAGARPGYGIALASRWPLLRTWLARFPAAPVALPLLVPGSGGPRLAAVRDEPRRAIAAVVDAPGGPLTVVATHLSFVPGRNVRQLRRLAVASRDLPRPLLLAGDLNLPVGVARRASAMVALVSRPSYPVWRPRVQLDHVLAAGLGADRVAATTVLRLPVSDHAAVVVAVRV